MNKFGTRAADMRNFVSVFVGCCAAVVWWFYVRNLAVEFMRMGPWVLVPPISAGFAVGVAVAAIAT